MKLAISSCFAVLSLILVLGTLAGCASGGPPAPTAQTSGAGIDSKKMLKNVENSGMPDFAKKKREKVLQSRINAGMP